MKRRDDKKPASTTSQDALLDYLQQMLFDAEEPAPATAAPQATAIAQPPEVVAPKTTSENIAVDPPVRSQRSETVPSGNSTAPFAGDDDHAKATELQQKLLQARVKDLAEKSVQAAKEQQAQRLQQVQREAERRERMDAARALVKQRIAARLSTDAAPVEPAVELQTPETLLPEADAAIPEELPQQLEQKPQAWLENGRPAWAQNAFECLLFSVSGLTLAVPLVELGSIYPIKDHLTPIIGQIDWFLGLLHVHGRGHVRTVNTAKIVMPEKYDAAFVDDIRYVISINGYDWGLAVDNVDKAITLVPEDVRWRTERSKRPWLAGTVVDYMCALVDVQELAVMLSSADRSKPRLRH